MHTKIASKQYKIQESICFNTKYYIESFLLKYLKTVGIIQIDTCSFRQSESEEIEHILFYCHESRELWTQLSSFIFRKINKHTQFDIKNVMFGVFDSSSLPINVIII